MIQRSATRRKIAESDGSQAPAAPYPQFLTSKVMILDPLLARNLIIERQQKGIDKYDEIWEGVYVMPAAPSNPHQDLVGEFNDIFRQVVVHEKRGRVQPGANVSDRREGWEHNHRAPDVVVVLDTGIAVDCMTHWFGGPDFIVEIESRGQGTEEKIPFYGKVRVTELLIVERDTRHLRLYRHNGETLALVGQSDAGNPAWLQSSVLPLAFRWKSTKDGPRTEVKRTDGKTGKWVV